MATNVPRCAQHTGKECRDCVECLSVIPDGRTCGGCRHSYRCTVFGFTDSLSSGFCSFYPMRYSPVPERTT